MLKLQGLDGLSLLLPLKSIDLRREPYSAINLGGSLAELERMPPHRLLHNGLGYLPLLTLNLRISSFFDINIRKNTSGLFIFPLRKMGNG